MLSDPWRFVRRPFRSFFYRYAEHYLRQAGVMPLLVAGNPNEKAPDYSDLYRLHRLVMIRKPKVILEFGTGFSTVVMAHALKGGRLYGVDSSEKWIENVRRKLPAKLATCVDLRYSPVELHEHNGELCHRYMTLPNIVPDFIYLDGPDFADLGASAANDTPAPIRGLSFTPERGIRQQIASDILLYESTLRTGAFIIVDSRYNNVHFLHRNLKRTWRVKMNRTLRSTTFELLEHTGRQ